MLNSVNLSFKTLPLPSLSNGYPRLIFLFHKSLVILSQVWKETEAQEIEECLVNC